MQGIYQFVLAFGVGCFCALSAFAQGSASAVATEPNQQSDVTPLEGEADRSIRFLTGTKFVLKPRAYYLDRDRDLNQDSSGFALGGSAQYESGWAFERLQLRATLYTSQPAYGPRDEDGTQLFLPGPEGLTVLGEANAVFRATDSDVLRIGRQLFELPYLGSHDIRMVPNTFEAVAFGNTAPIGLGYVVGYVDRIKRKDADEFIPMSEAAGIENGDDGVIMAGARYVLADNLEIAIVDQYTTNVFNSLFAKVERNFSLAEGRSFKAFVQYTDQRSVGDELIGNFTTALLAAKGEYSWGNAVLRFGVSTTHEGKGIQSPYGNPANYLSVMVEDFDRAGEEAWMIGGNYKFPRIGPGELSLFGNFVRGDTPDSGPAASPDENEYDLTVDYRVIEGAAKSLWVRFRTAYVDQIERIGGDDFIDFRVIVNWSFSVL